MCAYFPLGGSALALFGPQHQRRAGVAAQGRQTVEQYARVARGGSPPRLLEITSCRPGDFK